MTHNGSRDPRPQSQSTDEAPIQPALFRSRDPGYLRAVIDRRLGLLVPTPQTHPAALHGAMRHILLAPGKRLRPLLTLAAALQLDAPEQQVLDFGCALEMIHASSLILDDLPCMDNAQVRRAQPTTHVQYGEDVAMLAAIALLSRAFGIAGAAPGVAQEVRLHAVNVLSFAVGSMGLCGGQLDDLNPVPGRTVAATEDVNRRKTGMLFTAAVEIASKAADASEAKAALLLDFAGHVGRAYQLLDDLLDVSGTTADLGKDVGKDTDRETVVASLGAPRAKRLLAEHLSGALSASAALGPNKEGQEPLKDFIDATFGPFMGSAAP